MDRAVQRLYTSIGNTKVTDHKVLPVPSAATLSLAGPDRIELSDALFRTEAAILRLRLYITWNTTYASGKSELLSINNMSIACIWFK